MNFNIPNTPQHRVVIVGAGFGGVTLARKLAKMPEFQVVLIDKNNYHQFQPLFYQVAMAGLEPSSIAFPLRKIFQGNKSVFVRVTEVEQVDTARQVIQTGLGELRYDFLVVAIGADTNWYGNERVRANAIPMKSVSEALFLRNKIFEDYELAVTAESPERREEFLDIVIVGGGPTGVEVAGALAEMKRHIIPKDYHDLDGRLIDIHLVHGNERVLNTMSPQASAAAERYLRDLGIILHLDKVVKDYDGETVTIDDGTILRAKKVIWAAGISGNKMPGLPSDSIGRGNRILVDGYNKIKGCTHEYAIGDICLQTTEEAFPNGHPQVAQVAIQQADLLANNLLAQVVKEESIQEFSYNDLGSMATVGRHRAVVDLKFWKFQGAFAWFTWLFVHLFALIGTKNKVFVFLNWLWNYFSYDQSLRLVIKPWKRTT